MDLHELGQQFNKEYYEDGVRHRVSGYEKYHFIPERSFPEAVSIRDGLRQEGINFNTVIDYGCAKGFLVYALQMLGYNAVGLDISEYAINSCHPEVRDRVHLLDGKISTTPYRADLLIAKDVLEHIPENNIPEVLSDFRDVSAFVLAVIPFGAEGLFRIREYQMDETHRTMQDEAWWLNRFYQAGFMLKRFDYKMGAVKEKWLKDHPYGNGFFVLENPTPPISPNGTEN